MLYLKRDFEIHRDHTGKSQSATVSCKCYNNHVTKTVMKKENQEDAEATHEVQITDWDNMTLLGTTDIEWFIPNELAITGTSETDVAGGIDTWFPVLNEYQPIIDAEQQLLTDFAD